MSKTRLIFGAYLLVLIVVAELIFHHFHLAAWPGFMVMIFFFVEHMDIKKASHILVGGLVGMALVLCAAPFIGAVAPLVGGPELANLLFIVLVVYSIVAFGEIVPMVFNNYAFMFLTVSAAVAKATMPNKAPELLQWMAVELVGGSLLIAGVVLIGKIMAATGAAPAPTPEGTPQH